MAAGFLDIAVANMANAIKKISVQRGYDVTRYVLATFGGAGGQHACAVADALGITEVLIHPLAGVLSAYGMGLADVTVMREAAVEEALDEGLIGRLEQAAGDLEAAGRAELAAGEVPGGQVCCTRRAQLRYLGTDTALTVPFGDVASMMAAFEAAYRQRFSFLMRDKPVMVEAVSVEVTRAPGDSAGDLPTVAAASISAPPAAARVAMFTGGGWARVDLLPRSALRPGRVVRGPALITEDFATTVVEPGWQAAVTGRGDLLLTRPGGRPVPSGIGTDDQQGADPVMLEIFNNLFMSVAEQMGVRLQGTAHSVNIKERLDFSCAIFDAAGHLIANAPHMPVHLGSMGESIKMIISRNPGAMKTGDVFMLNDPYHGGTHLPDITVVTPVFSGDGPTAGAQTPCSSWPPAGITPRSAASRQAPCPPSAPGSTRKACSSTTGGSWSAARCARPPPWTCSPRRSSRPATPAPTSPTFAPRSRRTRRAPPSCASWSATSAWTW